MAHDLGQRRLTGPLHGEHRTIRFPDRGKLCGITDEDQSGLEGMGTLQCDAEQGAVHH